MNKRQQKKQFKKALDVLNDIELYEADYESEGVLYILIEDNENSQLMLQEFCGLLGINKNKFIAAYGEHVDDGYLDLVNIWLFITEPKGYTTYHSPLNGFSLNRCDERNE
ncbi:hypothetical protein A5819_003460 [Enterococcus sp. 7E2_DIV0204]|uniref:hypothetical protein n=1 Tax=unclassified Enterococcus TaxID=2608891 RepID=UPI000A33514B|nr:MULTISPECIES: hypothetical protein [unclassified Enterococcus]OTN83711.1 hypothetical protein A5819_003808 [Enterococcus sp. 7E2_DIV0204]OTN86282.1 hypothetical protein A5819_003116 [Enterococcus sp. 7E2_DIV0204]OTN86610.1 hypothetical protein A5819_003460 [Enterococcus sp. 7E2_DIV0204]OTP47601.1 hypothetical protein A5884_003356 [Enterococcus sp. 7D2_DIV0200]OTP48525.1 hypothetical protein A5884_003188 [Enterococcus sp. 7D2_DIV0200]